MSTDLKYRVESESARINWVGGESISANTYRLLPPFYGKQVIALGYNYKDLLGETAKEKLPEPLMFYKSPYSVQLSDEPIQTLTDNYTWVEVELGVLVNRYLYQASLAEAQDSIEGFLVASDMSCQNLYGRDHHLARSKGLKGFCPVSSGLLPNFNFENRSLSTTVNGVKTQSSNTNQLILNPYECVHLISQYIPLGPGDLVLTGTPAGAVQSRVLPGDKVVHEIEGLGSIELSISETTKTADIFEEKIDRHFEEMPEK